MDTVPYNATRRATTAGSSRSGEIEEEETLTKILMGAINRTVDRAIAVDSNSKDSQKAKGKLPEKH